MAASQRSLVGNIVGWDQGNNTIFDEDNARNRDDCLEPFRRLRQEFVARGCTLDTVDVNARAGIPPDFNLYVEPADVTTPGANYLMRYESEMLVPRNADPDYLGRFDGIFTWESRLVDGQRFVRMFHPNAVTVSTRFGFEGRPEFCTMIASNKHEASDKRELYSKRADAIRWFERHAPQRFSLYGVGWEKPPTTSGPFGRWRFRVDRLLSRLGGGPATPSYRGRVNAKRDVLARSRFCIAFENAVIDDYVTEKVFDCFFAGCVPVYWGAPNVNELIPPECFVDMRQFAGFDAMYRHLEAMSEERYVAHQRAIADFLQGPRFERFTSAYFAKTVADKVLLDLSARAA